MRNILQLGLHTSAEWIYLTDTNWTKAMKNQDPTHQLPNFYTKDKMAFRYFGVDVSPGSINNVRETYKTHNNTHFITCGIGEKFYIENHHNKWYNEKTGEWYEFLDETKNTLFVFLPLGFLIENLGINDLTVLAVDIDGHEDEGFSDIKNWKIKPEFITTEISTLWIEKEKHPKLIIDAGYKHIRTIPQYTKEEIETSPYPDLEYLHEQQFLRNDIYEQHKQNI